MGAPVKGAPSHGGLVGETRSRPAAPPWLAAALESQLRSRYRIVEEEVLAGGRRWRLLRPAEVELTPETDPDAIPFWMDLWESSVALAGYLRLHAGRLPRRALELGSGLGMAGLGAAASGLEVVLSDVFPDALAFARLNALRNGLDLTCVAFDWRRPALGRRFPLVLGADLLYEPTLHAPLRGALSACLEPGGLALLADPSRRYGLDFMAGLESQGWEVDLHPWEERAGSGAPVVIYEARSPRQP